MLEQGHLNEGTFTVRDLVTTAAGEPFFGQGAGATLAPPEGWLRGRPPPIATGFLYERAEIRDLEAWPIGLRDVSGKSLKPGNYAAVAV
jgi:hypothetical protein